MSNVGKRGRCLWAALLLIAGGGAWAGCSVIFGIRDECTTDTDCASRGTALQCRSGLCVGTSGLDEQEAGPEEEPEARKGPVMPAELLGATCTRVFGVPLDEPLPDKAILLGALHPLSGELEKLGRALDQATEMAIAEINQVGGLFGRKFVVVTCDTATDPSTAVAAARHLVEVVQVPAVLGPFASSVAISVYNDVLQDAGVVMVTAGANSPVVADISTDELIWSTSMSAARQARAIVELLLVENAERVAVVYRDDTWGKAMLGEVQKGYCEAQDCGSERYMGREYGVGEVTAAQSQVVAALDGFDPDIVVLLAYVKDAISFLNLADQSSNVKKILTVDALHGTVVFDLVPHGESLCRLVGTTAALPSGAVFESFALRFEAKWGPGIVPYTAHAYDAAYLLPLALVAAIATNEPVTGGTIAAAMRRLSAGDPIEPGSQRDWVRAIQALSTSAQTTVDYVGASGDVDFTAGANSVVTAVEAYRLNLERTVPQSLGTVLSAEGVFQELDLSGVQDAECASFLDQETTELPTGDDPSPEEPPAT